MAVKYILCHAIDSLTNATVRAIMHDVYYLCALKTLNIGGKKGWGWSKKLTEKLLSQ